MSYRNRRMTAGGRTCGGMNQPPCNGGYRRGGRTRRRMQQGGHTHQMYNYAFGHTHQNGQTIYDPNNVSIHGPIHGYDPNGQHVFIETTTQTAGGHNHPTAIQRRQRGGTARRFGHGGHTNSRSYRKRDNSGTGRSH
tara:strand:- start:375 stop:785 length:411 start_codon:yes stop_codon:yes gene_type:complete